MNRIDITYTRRIFILMTTSLKAQTLSCFILCTILLMCIFWSEQTLRAILSSQSIKRAQKKKVAYVITVLNKIPQAAEIAANVSGYKPVLMRAEMPLKSVGSREIMCARCFGKNETVDVDYVQRCVKS